MTSKNGKKSYDWIIVGGGIAGIFAAWWLASKSLRAVVIDKADDLGGVLQPRRWDRFDVDNGCHLLDIDSPIIADFYAAMLKKDLKGLDLRYATINEGFRTDGLAIPDVSHWSASDVSKALADFDACSVPDQSSENLTFGDTNLATFLDRLFGQSLGRYLCKCAFKMTGIDPELISCRAFSQLPLLHRVRVADDSTMVSLKSRSTRHDAHLAARQQYRLGGEAGRAQSFYPARGGLRAFCDGARRWLIEKGVDLSLGVSLQNIETDNDDFLSVYLGEDQVVRGARLFWTLPTSLLPHFFDAVTGPPLHRVGMNLCAILIDDPLVDDILYLHDYEPSSPVFRASTQGRYSGQIRSNGQTFALIESVRTSASTGPLIPGWRKQAIERLIEIGFLTDWPKCIEQTGVWEFPTIYTVPAFTDDSRWDEFESSLNTIDSRIKFHRSMSFGKTSIIQATHQLLECSLGEDT